MNIKRLVLLGQLKEAICGGLTTIEHCRELIDSIIDMEKENGNKMVDTYDNKQTQCNSDVISFESYKDAVAALNNMKQLINDYGYVTVADYYDLIGESSTFQQTKYGWTNLKTGNIMSTQIGYILILPEPKYIQTQQKGGQNNENPKMA